MQRLADGEEVSLVSQQLSLRPLPRRFHAKSARVRVFHLFLKSRNPRNLTTGEILPPTLLQNGMADARTITDTRSPHTNRLAARLLLGDSTRTARSDLEGLARRHIQGDSGTGEILASHLIPPESLEALLANDIEIFLELREREIIREERAFASQYVQLSDEESEEEPEIDVEEAPISD